MKRSLIATTLVAATVLGCVVTVHAQMREGVSQPQPGQQDTPETARKQHDPSFPSPGHPQGYRLQEQEALDLAGKLAAAEIYIGIKPDQLATWRTYTEALLDLLSSGRLESPPPPSQDPSREMDAQSPPPGPQGGRNELKPQLPGEALSVLVLNKAEKAKVLQDAIGVLKSKLSLSQIDKLAELDRNLMRRPLPPRAHEPDHRAFHGPMLDDHQPKG